MIKRKNHETALKALTQLKEPNIIYLICGKGELEAYLKEITKTLGIEQKVKFLGYRDDVTEICQASEFFIFPSYQEGLSVSMM